MSAPLGKFDGLTFIAVPDGAVEFPSLTPEDIALLTPNVVLYKEGTRDYYVRASLWERLKLHLQSLEGR